MHRNIWRSWHLVMRYQMEDATRSFSMFLVFSVGVPWSWPCTVSSTVLEADAGNQTWKPDTTTCFLPGEDSEGISLIYKYLTGGCRENRVRLCQWHPLPWQEGMSTNWNTGDSLWTSGALLGCAGERELTQLPREAVGSHPWRSPKVQVWAWTSCSGCHCWSRSCARCTQSFLPASALLAFWVSLKTIQTHGKGEQG